MNIHEYQAKKILQQYGIRVPNGGIAYTPTEAKRVADQVSKRGPWVLKAQIKSGARQKGYFVEDDAGSAGGIRLIKSRREIAENTEQMLGSTLVTIQTGSAGKPVDRVYVEEYHKVHRVFYAGIAIDRQQSSLCLLIAPLGDEDIISKAFNHPEEILKLDLDLDGKTKPEQVREILDFLKLPAKCAANLETLVNGMHRAFIENDAIMIEINPVCVMKSGELVALDAKISFDDNALFRHKEIAKLKDDYAVSDRELLASKYKFVYNELNGSIGCITNGDGVALAAMDMLAAKGLETACTLNVRGAVDKDNIASGIKIIMTNPRVEGVLIDVLGGFLRCNLIAEGIVSAASEVGLNVPLVVRFEGTNKEEAKEILEKSKLPIIMAESIEDAIDKLVTAMEEVE